MSFEINRMTARTCSMLGQRGAIFGMAALEMAKNDPKFILLTADLATLSGMDRYTKQFPDQFVNVGIAEQNMIGISAGLAAEGYHPAATTYATFVTMRACEQIRHFLGYMNLGITVLGSGAGLSQGFAGNTHYTIEDISMMRAIPGLTIFSPADAASAVCIFNLAMESQKPVYIRLTGGLNCPMVYKESAEFSIGGSNKLREGDDVSIFACGTMVDLALKAAKLLDEKGISAEVVDMYCLKPVDRSAIEGSRGKKLVVSIEEHNKMGGLGSIIGETLSEGRDFPPLLRLGIEDTFNLAGDPQNLLEQNRLTPETVTEDILKVLSSLSAQS